MSTGKKQGMDTPDTEITVDSMGIPILNEVIESESSELVKPTQPHRAVGLNLPRHNQLLPALRQQLKTALKAELATMIDQISSTIASEINLKLEQQIRDQLSSTMEKRLADLLDDALKK